MDKKSNSTKSLAPPKYWSKIRHLVRKSYY